MSNTINLPTGRDMVSLLGMDFFKEETRCDYLVSEKMKKIWAVNLDLYLEFVRICDKYDLKYYPYGGTLLGAVRHNGNIPWDDDMDVCMPRKDYEEFLKLAPTELTDPYLLQTPYTEDGYYRTMTRLSNRLTTRIAQFFKHSGMSHGLMLDIFPLDDYNELTHIQDMEKIALSAKRCSQYMKRNDTDIMTPEHYSSWKKYMTNNPMKEWENIQIIAQKYNNSGSAFYSCKVLILDGKCNLPQNKEWFETTKIVDFENLKIKIPTGYDSLLRLFYGDYMKYPPIEQRGAWHHGLVLDPEKPYTEYM